MPAPESAASILEAMTTTEIPNATAKSRWALRIAAAVLLLAAIDANVSAATKRIVTMKVDGLPFSLVDRFAGERDPRTGKSMLPWIDYLFYKRGTVVSNFYVRGLSLSAPSWSMLATGRHSQIKGNVEFDRFTLRSYDYLNFFPFYVNAALSGQVDMPGVAVLDELGIPLLNDMYSAAERYDSFQLYQREVRWETIKRGLPNYFKKRSPGEMIGDLTTGLDIRGVLYEQLEREIKEKLKDPNVRYLDYFIPELDHVTHHNRDIGTHLAALRELDALIGRIWNSIELSPLRDETALIIVSDHGSNTSEDAFSQGFNLVSFLGAPDAGGHHVVTKRRPLLDYSVKGLNPLVTFVITPSSDSHYLKDQSSKYPTAVLDFDGNERASVHLRNSDLNLIHLLLIELTRTNLDPAVRRAAVDALLDVVARNRREWAPVVTELEQELGAVGRAIERGSAIEMAQNKKKWSDAERKAGLETAARRNSVRIRQWRSDRQTYARYVAAISNLLALDREKLAGRPQIDVLMPERSAGFPNSIHQLQNYVVGLGPSGLRLKQDGSLDLQLSFSRVDYFSLCGEARVRNNVQPGVENRPIDIIAARVPLGVVAAQLAADEKPDQDPIWLYTSGDRQALILARGAAADVALKYVPISNLKQDVEGLVSFDRADWSPGFPLAMFESADLAVAPSERRDWLSRWHREVEWLRAVHRTQYSNAIIGLQEYFYRYPAPGTDATRPGLAEDQRLLNRFCRRQRELTDADLLLLASNHWDFDVRGFNPGGNHGSFFRVSTHSTLMFAGGERTNLPRALVVEEPYDSLSLVPSVLALTGRLPEADLVPVSMHTGSYVFPGRVIKELFQGQTARPATSIGGTGGVQHR